VLLIREQPILLILVEKKKREWLGQVEEELEVMFYESTKLL
jgi:hypothetical protein